MLHPHSHGDDDDDLPSLDAGRRRRHGTAGVVHALRHRCRRRRELRLPAGGGEHSLLSVDENLYVYGERSRVLEKVVNTAEVEYARSDDGSKYKVGYDLYSQHYYVPYVESLVSIRFCNY